MLMNRMGIHNSAFCGPDASRLIITNSATRIRKLKSSVIVVPRMEPRWILPKVARLLGCWVTWYAATQQPSNLATEQPSNYAQSMHFETKAVHAGGEPDEATGAI